MPKLSWIAFVAALALAGSARAALPESGYRVVHTYPHDTAAFTEGLFYLDGQLYESTGMNGQSEIKREDLATGKVLQRQSIPPQYFGEGIVPWKDRLYELTWQNHVGFVYDLKTFRPIAKFEYPGEGWALTHDDRRIIMSDGTPELRFLDPMTMREQGRITVTDEGRPVANLNEIEFVKGEILANIWHTNRIARIDPQTGHVTGWIDLTGLLPAAKTPADPEGVLNGIAYDAKGDRLFVTGKLWPALYEIKLVPKAAPKARNRHG